MDLNTIRSKLRRLEDTICISLFERSQFKLNSIIYQKGEFEIPDFEGSFFEYLFRETELVHASAGRYINREEHPFFISPDAPIIPRRQDIEGDSSGVNLNKNILSSYLAMLPLLCATGDDNHYGSSAVQDITALQAISRRIHMGKQVAEAKYLEDPRGYDLLIQENRRADIRNKLRDHRIEEENLKRVCEKAKRYNLDGEIVKQFFKETIIPLTIDVEVLYFMSKKQEKV